MVESEPFVAAKPCLEGWGGGGREEGAMENRNEWQSGSEADNRRTLAAQH